MKAFLSILSAAVCAGLGTYALFNALFGFGLVRNQVVINIDVFVALLTVASISAAAFSVLFRTIVAIGDARMTRSLEQRIAELELRSTSLGGAADPTGVPGPR